MARQCLLPARHGVPALGCMQVLLKDHVLPIDASSNPDQYVDTGELKSPEGLRQGLHARADVLLLEIQHGGAGAAGMGIETSV